MSGVSNINDLPNSFVGGGSNESGQIYNSNIQLDKAELPRANIPLSTERISNDEQVKVNFVPETENEVYYIPQRGEENKEVVKSESLFDFIENMKAEEFKIPIIMGLLFIIFLLPAFQGIFKSFFSFAYDESEKLTNNGIYLQGMIFGLLSLVINKVA
jgi:hypothetical protein